MENRAKEIVANYLDSKSGLISTRAIVAVLYLIVRELQLANDYRRWKQ